MTKLENSNYDRSQKIKLRQNSKTKMVTKLKNLNKEEERNSKTQIMKVVIVTVAVVTAVIVKYFS